MRIFGPGPNLPEPLPYSPGIATIDRRLLQGHLV